METYENAIIFGAGASFDAGIPLLPSFVDKMWEYAYRGKAGSMPIPLEDKKILEEANTIRVELEAFNSRAIFDNHNLEDILSLLSFEALRGGEHASKYDKWVQAVARTVELSCKYPSSKKILRPFTEFLYHWFWAAFFKARRTSPIALITFNYDLVFERTLWEFFHTSNAANEESCRLHYYFRSYDFSIHRTPHRKNVAASGGGYFPDNWANVQFLPTSSVEIPYLKLHGSLNWTRGPLPNDELLEAVMDPLILPPVFNKMKGEVDDVWSKALEILRAAKNIIIVGYSLPKTDIYMQYFLKSAVGPNSGLQRIFVFNPALRRHDDESDMMRERYKECFAPPLHSRIEFIPTSPGLPGADDDPSVGLGTFYHFVQTLKGIPEKLLFGS